VVGLAGWAGQPFSLCSRRGELPGEADPL